MSRRIMWVTAAGALIAAAAWTIPALAAGGATGHKNVHFTDTFVGASISKTETVYKLHDSVLGDAASVQTTTSANATGGTDTTITYYGDATSVAKDTYTFGKPNAQGIIPFSGTGHDIRGTGKLKGLHSSYTFTGTFDPKTTIVHGTLTGTESYQ